MMKLGDKDEREVKNKPLQYTPLFKTDFIFHYSVKNDCSRSYENTRNHRTQPFTYSFGHFTCNILSFSVSFQ